VSCLPGSLPGFGIPTPLPSAFRSWGVVAARPALAHYDGMQFIYEWERGWILAVQVADDGTPQLELFAPEVKLTRPIDMKIGPDGALYVIEFGTGWDDNADAQIVRIEPAAEASATATLSPMPSDQEVAEYYQPCLDGGDAARGQRLFFEKVEASCHRCHRASDAGPGGDIGPDLRDIGSKRTRAELLESLILPNRVIAKGFETTLVSMDDGRQHAGVVKRETDTSLELVDPENGPVVLEKDAIELRVTGLSPMPADIRKVFSRDEVRDMVAFLASLQTPPPATE
jgi:putative heme-binding domain-containing protein